jgi:hypothetical protein
VDRLTMDQVNYSVLGKVRQSGLHRVRGLAEAVYVIINSRSKTTCAVV